MKTNRLISLLLCLCMVATLFTGFAETASADDYITYTVKSGDNLYSLVGKMGMNYGTVKYVIMALNGFTNEAQLSQLQPGQTIILPTSNQAAASLAAKATTAATTAVATTAAAAAATATTATATTSTAASTYNGYTPAYYLVQHTVQKGENLTSICKALGTNYYDYSSVILKLNNMTSANSLKVGQTLWVPAKVGSAGGTIAVIAYSVKNGDTISGICAQYDTSYANYKDAVKAVNPKIANVEKLNVGQTVYIPVYTSYNNAVAGNPSTAAGTSGSPTTNIATGYAIGFTVPASAKYGNPFAIVGGQSNVSRATAGTTVVVRPNAYNGYAVKSIKVVRTDSNAHVQLNDYSFTMPNSNVQITIEYAQGKTIQKMPSSNGSFDTLVYGEISTTAFYGDRVEIIPYPNAGYEVNQVNVVNVTTGNLVVTNVYDDTGIYYFTMPNAEVRVTVTFRVSTTINLYYNRGFYLGSGVVQFYVNGVQVTQANQGDTVRMVIIPADGWIIDTNTNNDAANPSSLAAGTGVPAGTKVRNPNFNTVNDPLPIGTPPASSYIAVKVSGLEDDISKINDNIYEFKIPVAGSRTVPENPPASGTDILPGDVNVYVGFKQKIPYALTKENLSGKPQYGTVTFTVTDPITGEIRKNADYAFEGDIVEIVPYAPPVAVERTIGGITTAVAITYTYDANGAISGSGTDQYTTMYPSGSLVTSWTPGKVGYEFRMPASNVNVDPRFYDNGNTPTTIASTDVVANDIIISDNAHGTIEILDAAGNKIHKALPNTTVRVRITADKGYRIQREAFGAGPITKYGIYINFNDYNTTLTQLTSAAGGVASDGAAVCAANGIGHVGATATIIGAGLGERTNAQGNAVLEFDLVTPRLTDPSGNVYSLPIAITAFYETYNSDYTDVGGTTVTKNKVTLRTTNTNYPAGAAAPVSHDDRNPGNGRSPAVVGTITGVSTLSNIQMYVNGAPATEGTDVTVGTTVAFTFTIAEGYKLDGVWKRGDTSGGAPVNDQQLSPVDGIYYYTITQKDADANAGGGAGNWTFVEFEVVTEEIVSAQRFVFHSITSPDFLGLPLLNYTLEVWSNYAAFVAAGGVPAAADVQTPVSVDVQAVSGNYVVLRIPSPNALGEAYLNYRLAQVTVGYNNLTNGDLTAAPGIAGIDGWLYGFVMPDENVKTEVVYKEVELLDPLP